jgi:hypothetical protein
MRARLAGLAVKRSKTATQTRRGRASQRTRERVIGDESEKTERRRRARALLSVNGDQKRESRRACQRQTEAEV